MKGHVSKKGFCKASSVAVAILLMANVLTMSLASCTPAPAIPPPTPTSTPLPTTIAPQVAMPLNPEDDAWAKVVEAARKEGVVTVYSTGFVADIGRRITQSFRGQFGIEVEIMPGAGGILLERIKIEQAMKKQIADVFNIGGTNSTSDLVLRGGAERIAHELPALRDKSIFKVDPVYSPGGEIVNYTFYYNGPTININLVKPDDEPRSFNDLLAPRWKGKMLSTDPASGATTFYYHLRYHKVLDLDYFRHLAQQDIKMWGASPREAERTVARGEYPILLSATTDTLAPIVAEGAPLKILTPEEGNAGSPGGSTLVVKGAPHPNAARVFVNWLLSPEGQLAYAESASSATIRKDVPDFTHPRLRIQPKKVWLVTWKSTEWTSQDIAAKTIEEIFGPK